MPEHLIDHLPAHLRAMVGNTRGELAPRVEVMTRLHGMNPNYRVTFTHAVPDRVVKKFVKRGFQKFFDNVVVPGKPALWHLWEVRPGHKLDQLRRRAGHARLQRWLGYSAERQARLAGVPEQCEAMINGYYDVGSWPNYAIEYKDKLGNVTHVVHAFGSDKMFLELHETEARIADQVMRLKLEAQMDVDACEQLYEEQEQNTEFARDFRAMVRDAANDFHPSLFRGRLSRVVQGLRDEQPVSKAV